MNDVNIVAHRVKSLYRISFSMGRFTLSLKLDTGAKYTVISAGMLDDTLTEDDLKKIIMFGSHARGDYTDESDIDIAVLINKTRKDIDEYKDKLIELSTDIDLRNYVVVNFLCVPNDEFNEKKSYYPIYANIDKEGVIWYE